MRLHAYVLKQTKVSYLIMMKNYCKILTDIYFQQLLLLLSSDATKRATEFTHRIK